MLTPVYVNSICLSGSLGDKGLFRTANLLHIADVVHQVVSSSLEMSKMFCHYSLQKQLKLTQTCTQVLSVNGSIICNFAALDIIGQR